MNESNTPSVIESKGTSKRPLSLTILVIFASLLGISLLVGVGLGLRNVAQGLWANASPGELFLFFSTRLLGCALCGALVYAFARRNQAARWLAVSLLLLLTAYYIYFVLFVPTEQRAVNLPRFSYSNPAFGLSVERVTGICFMLFWTWHASFSRKAKLYFSSWQSPQGPQD